MTESERRRAFEIATANLPSIKWPGGPWTDAEVGILRKACAMRFDEDVRTETLFAIASVAVRIFKQRELAGETK